MKSFLAIVASTLLAFNASAGIITFNAEFNIQNVSGYSSDLIGTTVSATIDVDDTCGSNFGALCSDSNADLNLVVNGIDLGTDSAIWTDIHSSSLSEHFLGDESPFTFVDPLFNDAFFNFTGAGGTAFTAGTIDEDDNSWRYVVGQDGLLEGTFAITSRAIPEPGTFALLGLSVLALLRVRR